MIVRILGEGQYELDDAHHDTLHALDEEVEAAVSSGDDVALKAAVTQLVERVRSLGTPLEDDALVDSDLILPDDDTDVDQLHRWLDAKSADDGLIPD